MTAPTAAPRPEYPEMTAQHRAAYGALLAHTATCTSCLRGCAEGARLRRAEREARG
ncbi:hypothetical protein [Streptomyces sp. NPDC051569]|uniref:hypothetical protein n=1 Tax=Streptomyces sp. NPDC051569 TaxID=3365661 RepID=UPI0037B9C597